MSDKVYPSSSYSNINPIYNRAPCAKQIVETNQQQFHPYTVPVNNSFNQSNNLFEAFNVISPQLPQSCHKSQNICMFSSQDWEAQDAIKIPDKIEMIEITSKDLSPASYCSNLDLYMPDFYKSLSKDLNYYNGNATQWYSNNSYGNSSQKIPDFPSCAQINNQNSTGGIQNDKTVKYCSIQNIQKNSVNQDFDYTSDLAFSVQQNYAYNSTVYGGSCYENMKVLEPLPSQFFELPITGDQFQQIDQQTEASNDESDIIVEESDDENIEFDDNKKFPSENSRCIICNVLYTPLGTQFYFLTLKSPLTMSSQKPVFTKIISIVGKVKHKINYLCSECLGLINTIDHLQLKLDNYNKELMVKFQKSCQENGISKSDKINQKLRHKKKFKSDNIRYRCKLCKKILCLKYFCKLHYMKRHKFRGYLCELCGEISLNRRKFKLHYHQKHEFKVPRLDSFKCSNCPKAFRTKSNLKEHENYCLGLLPYNCKFCDKRFPSVTKLKNHVKLKHDKKFIAICSICNIGFVKLSDYKSHKVSHSTDKKFSCNKCDKTYKTLSNLNFHMKSHNKQLPFICNICNKGFMRKEYLEAHVNNHNSIKNFICLICDKKFVSQKNLDSHLKYHDGSAKTKTCNVCGKVMISGFEEHLRIHNNLMEFECDQCECKFNTKGTLAKHKKRKHSVVQSIIVKK